MAIIKKKSITLATDIQTSGTLSYWIEVSANAIELKVTDGDEVKAWQKLELSKLQSKPGFVDQTLWAINTKNGFYAVTGEEDTPVCFSPNEEDLIDVFSTTLVSKPNALVSFGSPASQALMMVFIKDSSADLTQAVIRLGVPVDGNYEVVGPSAADFSDADLNFKDLISDITLTSTGSLAADSSITVNVQSDSFIKEVIVEPLVGMVSKTRVSLTAGQGSFKLFSTGLESGDVARVKVGHRKFDSVATFTKTVS